MSTLKYLQYEGCGKCKLNGACKEFEKEVNITFTKGQVADCFGRNIRVFNGGEKVSGTAVIKNNKVYCAIAKKSEYKTKEDFAEAVKEEESKDVSIEDVGEGYMRYFPKGTEDSEDEFGKGVGVYQVVDKSSKGAFEVWIV